VLRKGLENVTQLLLLKFVVVACFAHVICQTPPSPPNEPKIEPKSANPAVKSKSNSEKLKRWLEIDGFAISTRYRYIGTNAHITAANQNQYQVQARGHFKFDPKGKYTVYAGVYTGTTLTSGWNNSGWGTGRDQTNLYLKQLYFDAKPVNGLEFQVGGLGVYNGENTEITGLDNDVYMTGERVFLRQPKSLYFDEVAVTNTYLGDVNTPNAFRRFKRLDESNYHQVMVRKQLGKNVAVSADYTFESGRDILHQAVSVKTPKFPVLDKIVFENYQRLGPESGYGFAVQGEKKLHTRLTVGGGFTRIDTPMFNGDRFPPGKRFFASGTWKLSREFSLNSVIIHGVEELPASSTPRTRLDVILSYNLLETLHRFKIF
jgi:hypothetical protein